MKRNESRKGASLMEFVFSLTLLVPLMLGVTAIGINLITVLEAIQLARDAGHMYARGVRFTTPASLEILKKVGESVGLTDNAASSQAVVILSAVRFCDAATCVDGGARLDGNGVPLNCPNFNSWVFTQQLVFPTGSTLQRSKFGTPSPSIMDNPTLGTIPANKFISEGSARVNSAFVGINPYSVIEGQIAGLPSGQIVYVSEAALKPFVMRPYTGTANIYANGFF